MLKSAYFLHLDKPCGDSRIPSVFIFVLMNGKHTWQNMVLWLGVRPGSSRIRATFGLTWRTLKSMVAAGERF